MLDTQTESQIIQHLSQILSLVHTTNFEEEPHSISAILKKNTTLQPINYANVQNNLRLQTNIHYQDLNIELTNFTKHSEKFSFVGKSLGTEATLAIDNNLKKLAVSQKTIEIRFWGIIHGKESDYYIVQGVKIPYVGEEKVGNYEKNGVGVNYYSYWVTNDIYEGVWIELPDIEPHHIQTARKIKKLFSGNLEQKVESFPEFVGFEKHYLKAQLVRITHGCELVPIGIYKVNDENPKIIEYEDEVKIGEFEALNSLEGWVHKNEMVLNLGRCSHYVDMSLPEEEIEVKQQELTENDPEIERLRVIVEDKIPEELGIGVESVWAIGVNGNSQVFTKEDSNLVYGVIGLKNIYWPGWTTIGYTNGYANIYIGNGLKSIQPSTSVYENANLELEAEEMDEYPEPFPLVLPPEPVEEEEQQNVNDE